MSTHAEDASAAGSVYSSAARHASASAASDLPSIAHKHGHASPHIGQIDSGKHTVGRDRMKGEIFGL